MHCNSCLHSHYFICMRREPVAKEVVYDAIAEPQKQTEQAQQESRENSAQGPTDASAMQQPKGKPRCITYYFKL